MGKFQKGSSDQLGLGAFGAGNVVKLDGGQRLRLDDKVDFWPIAGVWKVLATGEQGQGASAMLDFLLKERERAGGAVPEPQPIATERRVQCDYCGRPAQLHVGKDLYPDRQDLAAKRFWVCWHCEAWVGCREDEGDAQRPLGSLANAELRDARRAAHEAFAPLWQQGEMSREEAYDWLARATGIPAMRCRIAMMDIEQCHRVVEAVACRELD